MSRSLFLLIMIAIAAIALLGMWLAWRARGRRDAGVASLAGELTGALIAEFARVAYVSTTPLGSPFERVAIPGLGYKGYAALAVRTDGVEIAVTGERPVRIAAAGLRGTGTARGRVGKVVDRDGLSVLRWHADDGRELESSFRFDDSAEQRRFADAIDQISPIPSTSQEGAR